MKQLSAIVLTFNEEIHIRRCLENAFRVADEVFVIDSFSTDRTVEIAKEMGAVVLQNKWVNYAVQFNWALDNAPVKTDWVIRFDADEYLEDDLIREIEEKLPQEPEDVTGIQYHLKVKFLDKWMRHASPRVILILREALTGRCRYRDRHALPREPYRGGQETSYQHDRIRPHGIRFRRCESHRRRMGEERGRSHPVLGSHQNQQELMPCSPANQ